MLCSVLNKPTAYYSPETTGIRGSDIPCQRRQRRQRPARAVFRLPGEWYITERLQRSCAILTDMKIEGRAFIITGGCGALGGGAARAILAKGGIAVVGRSLSQLTSGVRHPASRRR